MALMTPTDPGAASIVKSARSDALASLGKEGPNWDPLKIAGRTAPAMASSEPPLPPPPPAATSETRNPPPGPPGAAPSTAMTPSDEPPPPPPPENTSPEDNGDPYSWSTVKNFVGAITKGTGVAAENILPAIGAKLGNWITQGVVGAAFLGDQAINTATKNPTKSDMAGSVIDFQKRYVDPAVAHWEPTTETRAGEGNGEMGALTGAVFQGAKVAPNLVTGAAGLIQLLSDTFSSTGRQEVDMGHSVNVAVANAAVETAANVAMIKWGVVPTLPMLKRVFVAMPAGAIIGIVKKITQYGVLMAAGHPDEANKIDITGGALEDAVQNGIFGLMPGHAKDEKGGKPGVIPGEEAPPGPPGSEDTIPPPPPPGPTTVAPATGPKPIEIPASAAPKVPDQPTAESSADLRSQIIHMHSPDSARTGVLITKGSQAILAGSKDANAASVRGMLNQARTQGRTIEVDTGTLMFKTKALAKAAQTRLTAGEDPQSVIGQATGAGTGKTPDQTVVVQGQTPKGNVAAESTVTPQEVPAAKQKAEDQGLTPVVTTPDAAIQRRLDTISTERNTPTQMGVMTTTSGKTVAVHIESGAPDGQTRVRALDAEGEPSDHAVDVPSDRVKVAEPKKEAAGQPSTPDTQPVVKAGLAPEAAHEAATSPNVEEAPGTPKPEGDEIGNEPMDMTKSKEERANIRADVAARRARAEGFSGELEPEPIPANAAFREGEAAKRDREEAAEIAREAAAEKPSEPTTEEPIKPKAAAPESALDSLPEALAAHEQQETVPESKKFPEGGLKERQDNAGAFAEVLKAAADDARGKVPVSAIERAVKAAKAAIGMSNKSNADMVKGRGTGHGMIDALVDEMHKAARGLLGEAKEGDEVTVAPKAAALKAKIAKKAQAKAAAEPEVKPEPKIASGIADVPNEAKKPSAAKSVLSTDDARTIQRLRTRLISVDQEDVPGIRSEIENFLHEKMSDHYTPDEIAQVLHLLDEQRLAENPKAVRERKQTMGDTIEDEDQRLGVKDITEGGYGLGGREVLSREVGSNAADRETLPSKDTAVRLTSEWNRLGESMTDDGAMSDLNERAYSGRPIGARDFMQMLINHTKTPILRTLFSFIHAHTPDLPIYMVHEVKDLNTGKALGTSIRGMLNPGEGEKLIQVRSSARDQVKTLSTAVHEVGHAATMFELRSNPTGKLAVELGQARDVLIKRLENKYGSEVIQSHMDMWEGKANALPEGMKSSNGGAGFMNHLYGIKDILEMTSEIFRNPDFMQEVAESEHWKMDNEGLNTSITEGKTLLGKVFHAIGNFFGIKDPALLRHIAGLSELTMRSQRARIEGGRGGWDALGGTNRDFSSSFSRNVQRALHLTPQDAQRVQPAFMALREEPPLIRGVDAVLSREVGDEPTKTARAFNWVMKNKVTEGLRTANISLKTVAQIFRDHRPDFGGRYDPQNPLNRLEDVDTAKNVITNKMNATARPVAEKWSRLNSEDNTTLGQLIMDSTMYKIDARLPDTKQPAAARGRTGFDERYAGYRARFQAMSPIMREIYGEQFDATRRIAKQSHMANVDTALTIFGADLNDAQRSLLYGVKRPADYDALIGKGKLVDIGGDNDKLTASLKDFAGATQMDGPYAHLGRNGNWVVSAKPEGTREFTDRSKAQEFVDNVNNMSPNSKAVLSERGGKFVVDYKAQYVSMHESKADAEAEQERMKKAGFDPGFVTGKILETNSNMGKGAQDLITAAESKLNRAGGSDKGTEALLQALRSAALQAAASRSAYASSRLVRQNFAGVKPEDMRRNFVEYTQSTAWHTGQLRTMFDKASAMAKLKDMTRDAHDTNADQGTMYRRSEVVKALNEHAQEDVNSFGRGNTVNAAMAKIGFFTYLASPAHAFIWMTQNFSTGIGTGGAKYGYNKSLVAHMRAMKTVASPAFVNTMRAKFLLGGDSSSVHDAIIAAVRADPRMSKWATGPNSPLQQLIDRGVINHGYSNELAAMAKGGGGSVERLFQWSRLLPNMADAFNRVSSALAGFEMTGGDIRKTADFVDGVHANYAQQNKPLLFKQISGVPGANSVTMFTTYRQSMIHLLYGNLVDSMTKSGRKTEAAKTVAGMVVANTLLAGVYGGIALEPLRLALYGYHKLFDKEGEVYDLKNTIHQFLINHLGKGAGQVAAGGIPRALGFDLSSRMGLADLFFHNPPDMLTADSGTNTKFLASELGPMAAMLTEMWPKAVGHMQRGETFQAISSLIPDKMWQDTMKAQQLWSTGKTNALGGQMTKPSALDTMYQTLGLKPADVAEAQERTGTKINYTQQVNAAKKSILEEYVSGSKAHAMVRLRSFNSLHPAEAISGDNLRAEMLKQQKSVSTAPGKDQELNKRLTGY